MSSRNRSQSLNALPPGTVLRDYVIKSELGSGGFSIVYLARHQLNPDWLYAIKEFLPGELAVRAQDGTTVCPVNTEAQQAFDDGLRRFRDEAEQLRKFRNEPYIVSCLNYFEQNGTAYLVMDHDDGLPLLELLRRREEAGQPFTEKDLLAVVEPLLEGLTAVHRAGVLHRDIKPGNVFVRQQDDITGRPAHPVLIDFGAAKQNYLARHSRSRAPYTPGYAGYEQISLTGEIGPWTDVYALGALMWRMVAGGCSGDHRLSLPDEAHSKQTESLVWSPTPREVEKRAYAVNRGRADPMPSAVELGAGRFSRRLLRAIDRCLALYPEDRVQSCDELRKLLKSQPTPKNAEQRQAGPRDRDGGKSKHLFTVGEADQVAVAQPPEMEGQVIAKAVRRSTGPWIGWAVLAVLIAIATTSSVLVAMWRAASIENGFSVQPLASQGPPFTIRTDPPQAQVVLTNRDEQYEAGMTLVEGNYQVEVSAPGYEPRREWLEHVEAIPEHQISLEPIRQAFTVEVEPAETRIRILNISPVYEPGIMLAAGRYRVEASAPGYDTVVETVEHGIAAPTVHRIELALSLAQLPGDGIATGTLEEGDHELSSGAYGDVWTLNLEVGQTLTADLSSVSFDSLLVIMDAQDSEILAEDDNSGTGTNARITVDVAEGGEYLIVASSNAAGETGDYELSVNLSSSSAVDRGERLVDAEVALPDVGQPLGELVAAYERGDYAAALPGLRIHAVQGHPRAQYFLGIMYHNGYGVTEDYAEAVRWYRLAAEQGHVLTQLILGFMYSSGEGVAKDDAEAVHWYRLAAEQSISLAQFSLGVIYDNGEGVVEDDAAAVRWYRLAAEQGHAAAQNNLGFKYDEGRGVAEDDAEAVSWYRLAAAQGNAIAQYNLGRMYVFGEGVPRNLVEGYAWLAVAEAQGHTAASDLMREIATLTGALLGSRDISDFVFGRKGNFGGLFRNFPYLSQSQVAEAEELSQTYWSLYVEPFQ